MVESLGLNGGDEKAENKGSQRPAVLLFIKASCCSIHKDLLFFCSCYVLSSSIHRSLEFFYSQRPAVVLFIKASSSSIYKNLEFFYSQRPAVLLFTKASSSAHKDLE